MTRKKKGKVTGKVHNNDDDDHGNVCMYDRGRAKVTRFYGIRIP